MTLASRRGWQSCSGLRDLETPIVQAGLGGIARHQLAVAVSEAGGLGTIAGAQAPIAAEVKAARSLTGKPIAVNLLLPFVAPGDVEAAAAADVIVTFWGTPRRLPANTWIHQCGSVAEAKDAAAAGADAVIAQGVEAGGHVRGTTPMLELLERVRADVDIPVLAAGGITNAADVAAALEAGAAAAVAGTRFLLSDECSAHDEYKQRCLGASDTVLTELFGLGWADAPHRVIANPATRRWLRNDPRAPRWIRTGNRMLAPLVNRIPASVQARALKAQRPSQPFLGPQPPTDDRAHEPSGIGPALRGPGSRSHRRRPARGGARVAAYAVTSQAPRSFAHRAFRPCQILLPSQNTGEQPTYAASEAISCEDSASS